jgi:23S rRNA (adenine2503-C2)-methyltransferase
MKHDLKGMSSLEIADWAVSQGLEAYRGRQIRRWLFKQLATSFDEMTDLPKALRTLLKRRASISHLRHLKTLCSEDGTEKYLFMLPDGVVIESVLIPEKGHHTICVSSQAGCAMSCRFCYTGEQGLKRNLSSAEIIEQVIHVTKTMEHPGQLTNIVFMGMGEPLANYDSVVKAIENLVAEDGLNFSKRKVTLSTCGLVPEMEKLGREMVVNLAVSLNAADDQTRDYLMPVNHTYPLPRLLSACRQFPLPNRSRITFEYVMIRDINDRDQDALSLVKLLSGVKAKINLIPLNPHPGSQLSPSLMESVHRFQKILLDRHCTAIIRKSKGSDILAACGQLSGLHK